MSDLSRYIKAKERTHASALNELKNRYKSSHWSWWEIPQIIGLGMTSTSREYAIRDLSVAKEYLANKTLRTHLLELFEALLSLETNDAEYVMGYPDDLKLRSCMTLFQTAEEERAHRVRRLLAHRARDGASALRRGENYMQDGES